MSINITARNSGGSLLTLANMDGNHVISLLNRKRENPFGDWKPVTLVMGSSLPRRKVLLFFIIVKIKREDY